MRCSTIGRCATPARRCDVDGALAKSGQPSAAALAKLKSDPYFALPAPKSLDRQHFKTLADGALGGLAPPTAPQRWSPSRSGRRREAVRTFPRPAREWLVCGGGRHNPCIMQGLRAALSCPGASGGGGRLERRRAGSAGLRLLAVRSLRGLPLSFPGTTGVPQPMPGGRHHAA